MADDESWTVREVEGRGSPGSSRGLPPASRLVLGRGDGELSAGLTDPLGETCAGTIRAIVEPGRFSHCPICLTSDPDSDEHVPQRGLGGKKMLLTCRRCNNSLGSRVERGLQSWYDRRLSDVRVSAPDVRGSRRMPDILVRQLENGEPLLIHNVGKLDMSIDSLLSSLSEGESTDLTLTFSVPSDLMVKIAALKHAYLAACLAIQDVPDSHEARCIRSLLVAARDSRRDEPLPSWEGFSDFAVRITGLAPIEFPILIVDWATQSGAVTEVVLGGTISTSWPLGEDDLLVAMKIAGNRDLRIEHSRREAQISAERVDHPTH